MNMRTTITAGLVAAASALLIAASSFAGFSGSDVFLPMVGRQAGAGTSSWYTTVWIHNPGAEVATARIYFLERNTVNTSPPSVDVMIEPGDTEAIENIVDTLFHKTAFGALRVTCPAKLAVTSRVFSQAVGAGEKDSVGQDFAGVPASFAIGAGEKTQVLGVYQTLPTADSEFRFNFGFVETTGHTVTVRVTAFDGNGTDQGSADIQVREFSQRQLAFKDYFKTTSTENTRLEVEVISGTGKVIAYGSGVANTSQDATTFEMTYKDSLLGSANVQHDATLTGDGTAASPLGVADASVAPAKIQPSGTAGQVLMTVPAGTGGVSAEAATPAGTTVAWQPLANGDITAVKTAAGGGLAGGATSGEANLFIATGGITGGMIFDGVITQSKLAAANGSWGQVLGTDGSALRWQADGLSLPWEGVSNAGSNKAVMKVGTSGWGTAFVAENTSSCGIISDEPPCGAIQGKSHTGIGIRAVTESYKPALQAVGRAGPNATLIDAWETESGSSVFRVDGTGKVFAKGGVEGQSSSGIGVRAVSGGNQTALQAVGGAGEWATLIDAWPAGYGGAAFRVDGNGKTFANGGVEGRSESGIAVRAVSAGTQVALQAVGGAGAGATLIDAWPEGYTGPAFRVDGTGKVFANGGVDGQSSSGIGVRAVSGGNQVALQAVGNRGPNATLIDAWPTGVGYAVFRVDGVGKVFAYGGVETPGADFAEMLPGREGLEPGDVLAIGADGRLIRSVEAYQASVVGVYSTAPGMVGGGGERQSREGKVPLAVVGVVPVKASAENGAIRPGDMLVAAATPGHAMRAGSRTPTGCVLGKALTGLADGTGTVTLLVMVR
jgi:hypothetical protein